MQVRAAIIQGGCQTRGWCVSTHIPERGPGGGPPSRSGRQLRTCDAAQGLAGPGAVGGPEANRGSGVELDVWVWDGGIGVPEVEPVGAGESAERLSSRQGGGKGRERQQGATYLSWYLRVRDCSVSPACDSEPVRDRPFKPGMSGIKHDHEQRQHVPGWTFDPHSRVLAGDRARAAVNGPRSASPKPAPLPVTRNRF